MKADNISAPKQENSIELLYKSNEAKIVIISSDNIIPPKAILTYQVIYEDMKVYATLGMNQLLLHSLSPNQ